MKYIILILTGLTLLSINPAIAGHYQAVFDTHEQCNENCEGECDNTQTETIRNCRQEYRDVRKDCRLDKREESKECRAAKKAEKSSCRLDKVDEIEACKLLSGKDKRECKRQARQNKRICKKQARITKRACKQEARDVKKECKVDSKEERDNCIVSAQNAGNACRQICTNTYESACVEERQAAQACAALARPIFEREASCKENCDENKEAGLEGYNAQCPNGHAGDNGATVTFYNGSGETRYIYKSRTNSSGLMLEDGSVENGDTYVAEVPCGIQQLFDFKRIPSEGIEDR